MGRALIASFFVLPALVFAQGGEELRAQIRADIEADPRSAELSSTEIDALVESIAVEAEQSGVAADYLESRSTFDYSTLFPEPDASYTLMDFLLSPIVVALTLLLLLLCAVAFYIVRRRGSPADVSDISG